MVVVLFVEDEGSLQVMEIEFLNLYLWVLDVNGILAKELDMVYGNDWKGCTLQENNSRLTRGASYV